MTFPTIRRIGRRKLASLTGIAGLALVMSGCSATAGFISVQGSLSSSLPSVFSYSLDNGSASLTLYCGTKVSKNTGNCAGRGVGYIGSTPFSSVGAIGGTIAIPANVLGGNPPAEAGIVLGAARVGLDPATHTLVSQPNAIYLDLSIDFGPRSPENTSFIAVIPVNTIIANNATHQITAQDVSSVSAALSFVQRQTGKDFSAWNTFLQQHPYLIGVTANTLTPSIPGGVIIAGFQCGNCATVIPTGQTISVGP